MRPARPATSCVAHNVYGAQEVIDLEATRDSGGVSASALTVASR